MQKNKKLLLLVFILSSISLFSGLVRTDIFIVDESRNASCAIEMMDRGEWIIPYYNGGYRFDKPPLHYYFMRLGYYLFGKTSLGARFFSAIFGLLTLWIVWVYSKRNIGVDAALWSVIALSSSIHFLLEFHLAVPDPYLIFFFTLALFSFYDFLHHGRKLEWFLIYISLAMGVLSKGPVALLLPGFIFLVFILFQKRQKWELIQSLNIPLGALIFVVLALPWYLLVWKQTQGEWLQAFIFDHNINRFASGKEGHSGSFFLVPMMTLLGMLPFSLLIFPGLRKAIGFERDSLSFYCTLAFASILIFFGLSGTKLPNYPMPAYPMMAVVAGIFVARNLNPGHWFYVVNIFIGMILTVGMYFVLMDNAELQDLSIALPSLLLIIPIAGIIAWILSVRRKDELSTFTVGAGWMLAGILIFAIAFPAIAARNSAGLAEMKFKLSEAQVVHYRRFHPAFSFYIQKPIPGYYDVNKMEYEFSLKDIDFVITQKKYDEDLSKIDALELVFEHKDLFEYTTTRVYKIK